MMAYNSEIYKGHAIIIVEKEDEEYFQGFYVRTIWFPTMEKAKEFIDRLTVDQEMNGL